MNMNLLSMEHLSMLANSEIVPTDIRQAALDHLNRRERRFWKGAGQKPSNYVPGLPFVPPLKATKAAAYQLNVVPKRLS